AAAVDLARVLAEDLRQLLEHLVACWMPVRIVYRLETIEIQHCNRDLLRGALGAVELLVQQAVDLAMVVKAGQSVADAEALELPVLLLELVLEPLDAEHRADARLELRKVDRLGQVVVSAGIEPHDLVLGRVARGHEDDRDE